MFKPQMVTTEEPLFTEAEAAARLGVSVERLYHVLDQHIFNQGERRPPNCMFRRSDLLLLALWVRSDPPTPSKVLRMPRRN